MIYLLRTAGLNENDEPVRLLKIGYTDDSRGDKRLNTYRHNGLDIRVLFKIPGGSIDLEHELQKSFEKYSLPWRKMWGGGVKEWFFDVKEITDAFESFTDDLSIINYLGYTTKAEFIKFIKSEKLGRRKTENVLLERSLTKMESNLGSEDKAVKFFRDFCSLGTTVERMKLLCDCEDKDILDKVFHYLPYSIEPYKDYYTILGPKKCAAYSYRLSALDKEVEHCNCVHRADVRDLVYSSFEVGKKYPLFQAKQIFRAIYDQCGSSRAPKAIDLEEFFDIRLTSIYLMDENGVKKKYKAYEILSRKDF